MSYSNRSNIQLDFYRLSSDHIEAIMEIERKVQYEPWSMEMFEDEVDHPLGFSWVACVGQTTVGYLCARIVGEVIEILNVAVHPDCQRQGIGERLLSWVLERANEEREASCAVLEVRASNEAALKLYVKLGFRVVGEREGYYIIPGGREKALLMECDIKNF